MTDFLFVGNFLSKTRGSIGPSEKIATQLQKLGYSIQLTSNVENQFLRLLDISFKILGFGGKFIFIDVFSGPAFRIAEVAARIGCFKKKQIILILHGGKLPEFAELNSGRIAKLFNRAFRIQTPSLFLKSYFEKQSFQLNYLPNSIDFTHFSYSKHQSKPVKLLWVRAFNDIYNPELAVKILAEVKKTLPNATLTMIGPDKGLKADTEKLIKNLGLENSIDILGAIPNNHLPAFYHNHSIFLNTTSYESFGVAVIEAAACGIPVVSASVGEIPYLWKHNENMMLATDFQPETFAKHVLNLYQDDILYDNISENAAQLCKKFDNRIIIEEWKTLIGELK